MNEGAEGLRSSPGYEPLKKGMITLQCGGDDAKAVALLSSAGLLRQWSQVYLGDRIRAPEIRISTDWPNAGARGYLPEPHETLSAL